MMQTAPAVPRELSLQLAFDIFRAVFPLAKAQTPGDPVNMGINGQGRLVKAFGESDRKPADWQTLWGLFRSTSTKNAMTCVS